MAPSKNGGVVVEIESAQDRFAEAAGADQRRERRGADVDHRAGFYAGEDGARSERQINFAQPRSRLEAERGGGVAQRWRDVLDPGGGVAHDREKPVKKERDNRGRRADPEKWHRHEKSEERERRNRLNHPDDGENRLANRAARLAAMPNGSPMRIERRSEMPASSR